MITIRTDNNKRVAQVCPTCHYVYEVVYDEHWNESVVLGPADNGNKPFIQLLDKNLIREEPCNDLRSVNLYACPRCLAIQLDNEEIED